MHILVVDDEVDMKILFEQKFRKEIRAGKISFAFAGTGNEALRFLNLHQREAVLILSDVNMPGMSGWQLLQQIKEKYKTPPPIVMMITAYGDAESRALALKMGADDFLTKPIDFNLLRQKLKLAH